MVAARVLVVRSIDVDADGIAVLLATETGAARAFRLRIDRESGGLEDEGDFTRFIWLNHYGDALRPILAALHRVMTGQRVVLPLEFHCGEI